MRGRKRERERGGRKKKETEKKRESCARIVAGMTAAAASYG